jgi:dTDP-4-amino-4,6-dideoxygalactose transaminase
MYDLGAERGDEIIIPASTFIATANAVVNAGFTPVFVDVDSRTLNIDVSLIDRYITKKTRAIMPVHLMGKPADMDAIKAIATNHNINVIEDAAEAHGAEYKGRQVGTIGGLGCFSLYAAHIISSIEGGMITTNSEYMANVCRSLRNHGLQLQGSNWTFGRIGYSSKMNELEACVGLGNLELMDGIIAIRKRNFKYLQEKLMMRFGEYFYTIREDSWETLSPHAFPIILNKQCPFTKNKFVEFLSSRGIDNRNLFYSIPTQTECYRYLGFQLGCYPNAEYLSNYGTHIGVHQDLNLDQLDYVIDTIAEFLTKEGCTF